MYVVTSLIPDYEHDTELRGVFDNIDDVRNFFINNNIKKDENGHYKKNIENRILSNGKIYVTYEYFTIYDVQLNKHYDYSAEIPEYIKERD